MTDKEIEKSLELIEEKIKQIKEPLVFKIDQIEKSINSLEQKIKDDIKSDIWELKQSSKNITQNEKNIAVIVEQFKGLNKQLDSYKKELEAKIVTHKDLEDKKYKDWRLWISIIAIALSIFTLFNNPNIVTFNKKGNTNVSTSSEK